MRGASCVAAQQQLKKRYKIRKRKSSAKVGLMLRKTTIDAKLRSNLNYVYPKASTSVQKSCLLMIIIIIIIII